MEGRADWSDAERIESLGEAYDLTSFSKEETSMEKSERMASLQFSQLREFMERMQKSITGIEKSMDFQCAMLRELRSSPPKLILSDADASDVRLETSEAGSKMPSVDRLDSLLSSPRSNVVSKRSRISHGGSISIDCQSFMEKHGRMPGNVRELEDFKATTLRKESASMSRHNSRRGSKTTSKPGPSSSEPLRPVKEPPEPPGHPLGHPEELGPESPGSPGSPGRSGNVVSELPGTVQKARLTTYNSQREMPSIVGKGWMSMEQLRQDYDAVVIASPTYTSPSRPSTDKEALKLGQSAFPCLGRFLLCLVGHLQFGTGWPSWLFSFFSIVVLPISSAGLLVGAMAVVFGASTNWSMALTLCFFQLGVSFASVSLKLNDIDLLLGPAENQLDDYAEERGFMKDWQRLSRRRLLETACLFVMMILGRALVNLSVGDRFGGRLVAERGFDVAVFSWCLWFMIIRFLLLCYSFLHVSSGLELALDSFTLRFFSELDIEEALEEWNVLQATLRQVSSKMSSSLLAIGFCALAALAILAEHVILTSKEIEIVVNWLSRFYPLILFFLYSIVRAAAVTEKASRVAPLVNSWQFQRSEDSDSWMDPGRQYAVQYINQSRAGFYLRGAQLTMPTAQRISYYLTALSVALLSRLFR